MQGCRRHVQDTHSGDRRLGWRRNGEGAASSVVRSVRRKCRAGSSSRQPVSREKEASRGDSRASRTNLTFTALVGVAVFTCQLIESYLTAVCRCATCAMGMMGMFKWLRKDTIRDRNGWNLTQKQYGLNNESYRNALQAFIDRRRSSNDVEIETSNSPDKLRADLSSKNNNNKCDNKWKSQELKSIIPGVPHIAAPEIFEIGWIAGTEDRYLELIFAEWQNTRVSLKRHSHPECKDAVKADLDILSEIRHPNVLLLMATTFTDDHGLVSIFESVDCTLYHYMHDQGERISMQGIAKCGGRLSDALRHSHMRGYVHTAISSHCVYLASNGIIKLGGWELAMHINNPKPKREYEERLRAEVFRWQAPELFHGYEPYKESDVYGLALLIWEMCTMHVPWNGYNKADVERQYVHWKRGVIMDLYNFPPLLYNLLEAGLQLDVNKRTLDMNRMRRFLQKLELQYENVEPVYIDQYMNNNNEILQKTYILQKKSPISKNKKLFRSLSTKQLSYSSKNADSPSKQHLHLKKSMSKQTLNQESHDEEMDFFVDDIKGNTRNDIKKNTNIFNNLHNNCKKSDYPTYIKKIPDIIQNEEESNAKEILQPWNSTYKKVKAPQEMAESRTTSMYSSPLLESTDDESFKDARTNLKQLKKVLASKREHFFYGSDSSPVSTDISPTIRDKIFTEIKSKDYEPHKPASHRTSIEPKCNKSPNQYDSSYLKSTFQSYRKIPYLHTPETIKDAIIQPQILNSDPQSFFETSLWRKEKLICLSKMRRICADESPRYLAQQTDESDTISVETVTKNQTTESISINSDNTYVIKSKTEATETETSQEGLTQVSENMNNSITPSQSEPLQILKDALDRATKIVRSITPNTNELCQSPTFRSYQDFEVIGDNNQDNKYIFENLYDLQVNDDNEEIKNIERSITKNKTFLFNESNIDNAIINDETQKKPNNLDVSIASIETCTRSYNTTCSRNFICECIAEVSNEFNNSYNDTISKKEKIESSNDEIIIIEDNANSLEVQNGISQNNYDTKLKIKGNEPKSIITNFDLMFINDTPNNKNCKTCYQSTLPRRRSLPATLSQLRTINNSALGKLPIRRGDIPDNTIEDLYIDDEFGDSLNVNMVLLHENLPIDEDFLSEISNL